MNQDTPNSVGAASDERFPAAFRAARETAGMSQDEVVRRMQGRNHTNFHQATIYKIERGERKVSLGEAVALADVVGHSIDSLFAENADSRSATVANVHDTYSKVVSHINELHQIAQYLWRDRRVLAEVAEAFDSKFGGVFADGKSAVEFVAPAADEDRAEAILMATRNASDAMLADLLSSPVVGKRID